MNHYDDLQRFKEKTRTHSLKFKDLSSEAAAGEKGDWVILNQLIPAEEASSLAMGGSVSLPLPQRVPADMFHKVEPAAVQAPPAPSLATPSLITPPSAPRPAPVTDMAAAVAVEPALPQSPAAAAPAPSRRFLRLLRSRYRPASLRRQSGRVRRPRRRRRVLPIFLRLKPRSR